MADVNSSEYLPSRHRSCFVYGCFSTAAANKPHLGFHKFPSRGKRNIVVVKKNGDRCIYDRRQLWIDSLNIGREAASAIDGVAVYVCSLHFAREDFYYNQDITGRRYLKELAIPRRNLPARRTSPLTTKFNVRSLHRVKYRGYFNIHNPDGRKLTAKRRYLGSKKPSKPELSQLYTKTVWVARKPNANKNPPEQVESAQKRVEDEQSTVLNSEQFTSELIIKEEPLSDTEQDPDQYMAGEDDDVEVLNDGDYSKPDSNKLVIETKNNEVEEADQEEETNVDYEDGKEAEIGDLQLPEEMNLPDVEGEGFEDTLAEEFEQTMEEFEDYEQNDQEVHEQNDEEDYYEAVETLEEEEENGVEEQEEVTVLQVGDDDEYEEEEEAYQGLCHICGSENCRGHSQAAKFGDNYFVCLICSEIFPSQKQLANHSLCHEDMSEEELQILEERQRTLTCEFCGRVLSTKSTLREHIMIHTGEKPHECLLCGKHFRHKANLVVHVNGHAVVSTYKCKKCNKAFTKKSDFEKHLKYHVDASGNPLVCKICNAVFKSQRTLYNHSQLHSKKGSVRAKRRGEGPRNPQFKCRTCGKGLSTKATLKEHMMIHSGEKPHECPICGRTIRHKANYVVHIQTHGQGRSYECDMCDEAFMRKLDLTQHKQSAHSKSKLLRCPICGEVFKSPIKFNRHMEIHESVVYMNETEELNGFEPHLLEDYLES
ncbi:zinc finger protein 37-like [Macrosteles quadrilineatus]|uniref:zinc finger protein 37-like n=1 Tax=Macrosteles quadrilineatus TaxID=74068 RepID=UPI0023E1EE3E|nr:zinc finger protein 37-like [Macrosteles quadrilineatus]